MAIWFTSDTHFHHTNVIEYSNRPFRSLDGRLLVWQMNKALIDNWNSVVAPEDTIYHLGDFAMGPKNLVAPVLKQLNGHKILIKGNHDRSCQFMIQHGFQEAYGELDIVVDDIKLYLHHQPIIGQYWQWTSKYHLHGHVHQAYKRRGRLINVGVDVWGYKPQSLQSLLSAEDEENGRR